MKAKSSKVKSPSVLRQKSVKRNISGVFSLYKTPEARIIALTKLLEKEVQPKNPDLTVVRMVEDARIGQMKVLKANQRHCVLMLEIAEDSIRSHLKARDWELARESIFQAFEIARRENVRAKMAPILEKIALKLEKELLKNFNLKRSKVTKEEISFVILLFEAACKMYRQTGNHSKVKTITAKMRGSKQS